MFSWWGRERTTSISRFSDLNSGPPLNTLMATRSPLVWEGLRTQHEQVYFEHTTLKEFLYTPPPLVWVGVWWVVSGSIEVYKNSHPQTSQGFLLFYESTQFNFIWLRAWAHPVVANVDGACCAVTKPVSAGPHEVSGIEHLNAMMSHCRFSRKRPF